VVEIGLSGPFSITQNRAHFSHAPMCDASDNARAGKFHRSRGKLGIWNRLVGIDDDPFCVSCAKAMLTFLYPEYANELNVFLHNCLYQEAPIHGEFTENSAAQPHLAAGRYDLVIGNPPGNDEYSGTNRDYVAEQWAERFGHAKGGLMDHHCFIRRAVELARPDGGRIDVLHPPLHRVQRIGRVRRDNRFRNLGRLDPMRFPVGIDSRHVRSSG